MDIVKYKVYTYRRFSYKNSISFYHSQDKTSGLDNQLKITKHIGNGKGKFTPEYYLSGFDKDKSNPAIKIFGSQFHRWFYGYYKWKKYFLIFEFREDGEFIKIYFFENFRPASPEVYLRNFVKH